MLFLAKTSIRFLLYSSRQKFLFEKYRVNELEEELEWNQLRGNEIPIHLWNGMIPSEWEFEHKYDFYSYSSIYLRWNNAHHNVFRFHGRWTDRIKITNKWKIIHLLSLKCLLTIKLKILGNIPKSRKNRQVKIKVVGIAVNLFKYLNFVQ